MEESPRDMYYAATAGTTPEQQAFYAPIAHEIMRQPDFRGMSYEHMLVLYHQAIEEIRVAISWCNDPSHPEPSVAIAALQRFLDGL